MKTPGTSGPQPAGTDPPGPSPERGDVIIIYVNHYLQMHCHCQCKEF